MIRFHLDENVNHAIAHALRARGLDVITATEAQLLGESDEHQLDYSIGEGRVLFTHDADFLAPTFLTRAHPGIVYSPKDRRTIGEVVRFLALLAEVAARGDITTIAGSPEHKYASYTQCIFVDRCQIQFAFGRTVFVASA